MKANQVSTAPYKGVRDFYPDEMSVQKYIFDIWSRTAESFGYEEYGSSVLEPAELYKSKTSEEIVNEQTYTFTDRGDREVTLRPEMTPTVARMIAAKQKELSFPVRWYSIPNLYRYERPQKGRLREHWQLNCDIFGSNHFTADVEIIALAYQMFLNFGAEPSMFQIRLNDRGQMEEHYNQLGIEDDEMIVQITRLNDRFHKISPTEYKGILFEIVKDKDLAEKIFDLVSTSPEAADNEVLNGLKELGIKNVVVDYSLARGFDYYTGTIFEFFDTSDQNNRALLGGGRYDNLTTLFGGDSVPGVGFGMGDVTMHDFLETHNLLTANVTAPTLIIIPTEETYNLASEKMAQEFRAGGITTAVDLSTRKLSKKLAAAGEKMINYALVIGEDEISKETLVVKNLDEGKEFSGTLAQLIEKLSW